MEGGSLVRLAEWVSLVTMRECFVRENGLVTCSKGWVKSTGLMVLFSEGISIEGRRKTGGFSGPIGVLMKATSDKISFRGKVSLSGRTTGSTKGSGRTT